METNSKKHWLYKKKWCQQLWIDLFIESIILQGLLLEQDLNCKPFIAKIDRCQAMLRKFIWRSKLSIIIFNVNYKNFSDFKHLLSALYIHLYFWQGVDGYHYYFLLGNLFSCLCLCVHDKNESHSIRARAKSKALNTTQVNQMVECGTGTKIGTKKSNDEIKCKR